MNQTSANSNVSRKTLWVGLLGGGSAWMLHLLLAWGIAEFGCVAGLGKTRAADISIVSWMVIAASVLTFTAALFATWMAYRSKKRIQKCANPGEQENELFTAQAGLITSGIFSAIIIVQSIPILFFLKDC